MRRHKSGNYIVEGRKKDLINRGGEKISAEEIENLILSHPSVKNASCVPIPGSGVGRAHVRVRAVARKCAAEFRRVETVFDGQGNREVQAPGAAGNHAGFSAVAVRQSFQENADRNDRAKNGRGTNEQGRRAGVAGKRCRLDEMPRVWRPGLRRLAAGAASLVSNEDEDSTASRLVTRQTKIKEPMRIIDVHCYPNTQEWIACQQPYVDALAEILEPSLGAQTGGRSRPGIHARGRRSNPRRAGPGNHRRHAAVFERLRFGDAEAPPASESFNPGPRSIHLKATKPCARRATPFKTWACWVFIFIRSWATSR